MELSVFLWRSGWVTTAAAVCYIAYLRRQISATQAGNDYLASTLAEATGALATTEAQLASEREQVARQSEELAKSADKNYALAERLQTARRQLEQQREVLDKAGTGLFKEGVPGAMLREVGLDYVPENLDNTNMDALFKASVGLGADGKPIQQRLLTSTSQRDGAIIGRLRDALDDAVKGIFDYLSEDYRRSLVSFLRVKATKGQWYELFQAGQVPARISELCADPDPADLSVELPVSTTLPDTEASKLQPFVPDQTGKRIEGGRPGKPAGFA